MSDHSADDIHHLGANIIYFGWMSWCWTQCLILCPDKFALNLATHSLCPSKAPTRSAIVKGPVVILAWCGKWAIKICVMPPICFHLPPSSIMSAPNPNHTPQQFLDHLQAFSLDSILAAFSHYQIWPAPSAEGQLDPMQC